MPTLWPFAANVLFFASVAASGPFRVLFYQSIGFTGPQIGVLTGLSPLVSLIGAPLWTQLADATRRHRLILGVATVGGAASLAVLPWLNTFGLVLLDTLVYSACLSPVTALIDSATMHMLAGAKEQYGRVRLGGTFGFGLAAYLSGLAVQRDGLKVAFWAGAAIMLLALFVGRKLAFNPAARREAQRGSVRVLLANPHWLPFLTAAFAGGLAMSAANTFLFPYLKELGADESTMGLALTLATISEVPVFFFGHRLLRRFKPYGLLMLALALTGARLTLFVVSPTPGFVLLLQLLGGMLFPAMWTGGVAYADEHAPPGLGATAQGLFGAMVFGFGSAVAGFVGGPLLAGLGGGGMFLVFGVVVLAIVLGVALWQRGRPGDSTPAPSHS
jgi:PPP family 3-phenylpropionic acid transporter